MELSQEFGSLEHQYDELRMNEEEPGAHQVEPTQVCTLTLII